MSHIETEIIHDTEGRKRFDGLINPPIARTSSVLFNTYEEFMAVEQLGYSDKSYGRSGTITTHTLAKAIANLAKAKHAMITSSGMSAISTTLFSLLNAGDRILVPDNVYICTRRLLDEDITRMGVEVVYYEPTITTEIEQLITPNTKILYLESPGSGTYEVQDLPTLIKIAYQHNIITILDDSWATPINLPGFGFGVDVTVTSLTKYINGHSDVFLGAICTDNSELYQQIYYTFRNLGCISSPEDCYLALRGLRTLPARLKMQSKNSIEIAQWLEAQAAVIKVLHPALPSFATHDLFKRDFKGSSATFSFVVNYSIDQVKNFVNGLKLFGIGLSWGGYESLIMPLNIRKYRTCSGKNYEGEIIRLHIGLENPQDLIIDLKDNMKI